MALIYIASQDRQGGILQCELREDGTLYPLRTYPLDRPAYLCAEGRRLYAVLRESFQMQSGVVSFDIAADGSLCHQSTPRPVHGTISAHILVRDGRVYCANYLSGSVTLLPHQIMAFGGSGPVAGRQDCSHPHCVTPTPDGQLLCVCDLGADCIRLCTPELQPVSSTSMPAGSGPRHLVFSPDGRYAYCSNELSSTVSVLGYAAGELRYLDSFSTLPPDFQGDSSASAIRMSGGRLYVSNRGHDSVAEFLAEGPSLTLLRHIPSHGRSPREIHVVGQWLLCANENSDTVCVISLGPDAGTDPVSVLSVKRPWCILPVTL